MAKHDFNSSRYAKFFADKTNQNFLQTFINSKDILYTNYGWYLTQGQKASAPTPTDKDGVAAFSVKGRKVSAAPMMDLRAPLGDSNQLDKGGLIFYTGTIPDFIAPGFVETASEREFRVRQFELFGNDADIVAEWVQNVQLQKDSVDATLNNMTAQLMSTGKIDYSQIGRGIRIPLASIPIPDDNFVTAGEYVWSDTTNCKVLEQMKQIEDNYRLTRGYTGALVWQIPRDMYYNYILENAQVKELIQDYRKNPLAYEATTEGQSFTEMIFRRAVVDYQGVSPIEVVTEKERNYTHATDTFVHGWDQNTAVLRPAGKVVTFEYTECLDRLMHERYGASTISAQFASINNGMATLVNTTTNNGRYKEWHTDVMMSAIPTLTDFPDHLIVDTATADA